MLWSALQTITELHGTSHTTSSLRIQKLNLTSLASLLAEARGDLELAGHWQSPTGICTTLTSVRCPEQVWMTHQDAQALPALPPGSEVQQAELLLCYQLQSLHAVVTEMGRTETLAERIIFQSPIFRQPGCACIHSYWHPSPSHMFSQACRPETKIYLLVSIKLTHISTLGIIKHRSIIR